MDPETPTPSSHGPTRQYVLAGLILVLVIGAVGGLTWRWLGRRAPDSKPAGSAAASTHLTPADSFDARLAQEVRDAVDSWIRTNRLNKYGDPEGTMYLGGTPLFDERTGRTQGRYEYILSKHPELLASTSRSGIGSGQGTNLFACCRSPNPFRNPRIRSPPDPTPDHEPPAPGGTASPERRPRRETGPQREPQTESKPEDRRPPRSTPSSRDDDFVPPPPPKPSPTPSPSVEPAPKPVPTRQPRCRPGLTGNERNVPCPRRPRLNLRGGAPGRKKEQSPQRRSARRPVAPWLSNTLFTTHLLLLVATFAAGWQMYFGWDRPNGMVHQKPNLEAVRAVGSAGEIDGIHEGQSGGPAAMIRNRIVVAFKEGVTPNRSPRWDGTGSHLGASLRGCAGSGGGHNSAGRSNPIVGSSQRASSRARRRA